MNAARNFIIWWLRQSRLGDRGVAMLELALLAPVLLLLMSGIWDFGNALFQAERLQSAAQAGAEYGVQTATTAANLTGIVQAARNDANDTTNSLTITAVQTCRCPGSTSAVSCSSSTVCSGSPPNAYIQVTVARNYTTMFTYPFVGNPISISRQAMIRYQ